MHGMSEDKPKEEKEIAVVEIHQNGDVSFFGSWVTVDGTTQDLGEAIRFNEFANSIGFVVGLSAHRCDDVRVLPIAEAQRLYDEAKNRRRGAPDE